MTEPKTPKSLDANKLRRFILERRRRRQVVNDLTDRFFELRQEIERATNGRPGAVEAEETEEALRKKPISQRVRPTQQLHPSERQRLRDLRADLDFVAQQRQAAERAFQDFAFVAELVEYARSCGYNVDDQQGTVSSPLLPDDRHHDERGGISGTRSTYVPDTIGRA